MPVYHKPFATNVPFDNSTNGFTATNVQDAIEEVSVGITAAYHQSKAVVISSSVIYVSYDPIISVATEFLTGVSI